VLLDQLGQLWGGTIGNDYPFREVRSGSANRARSALSLNNMNNYVIILGG
jgi:hypothetical protein